jgi:hypothetical protein
MKGLLAADPAVPLRDALLDPERFAARCAGGARPLGLERAVYRFGESLRVVHRVSVGGRTTRIAARSSGSSVLVTRLPVDREIADLAELLGGDLTKLVGATVDERQLVAYAPERSATVACLHGGQLVAFAKVFAGDQAERTERAHRHLELQPLRVPRLLGRRGRMLAVTPLAGTPLRDMIDDAQPAALHALGATMARFHAAGHPPAAPRFDRHDGARLTAAADTIGRARPELALGVSAVIRLLGEPPLAEPCCLHGDVHGGNVLVADGDAGLIDLDHVSTGPAAADLGSLAASLRYRELIGLAPPGSTDGAVDRVVAGYGARAPSRAALRWHEAAALVSERAQQAITRVQPEGLAALPRILGVAADLAWEARCGR